MSYTDVFQSTTAPVVIMSTEEAIAYERAFFGSGITATSVPTAELSADVVQVLALGGLTSTQVFMTALAAARDADDYGLGRIFDATTSTQRAYGKHIDAVVARVDSNSLITDSLVFKGDYKKARTQLMINSELKTDKYGNQYFEYLRRIHMPVANTYGNWQAFDKKNNVSRTLKLYVKNNVDAEGNAYSTFFTRKDGQNVTVQLGETSVYDGMLALIQASGAVELYNSALNTFSQDVREELSENQQKLFLTVFKTIKSGITPVA